MSQLSEGKHTIFAARHLLGGNLMLTPLLITRDDATFEKACAAVKAIGQDAPKLRRPTNGSARAIRVIGLEKRDLVFSAKNAGYLKRVPIPGETFESVGRCAEDLGLSAKSLRQVLYLARRANAGQDSDAMHLGIRFEYVESSTSVSI